MKRFIRNLTSAALFGLTSCLPVFAQTSSYTPTPENLQARQEFQDNKFGIFLHWGSTRSHHQERWSGNTGNNICYVFCPLLGC